MPAPKGFVSDDEADAALAPPPGFVTDQEADQNDPYLKAKQTLEGVGGSIMGAVNEASRAVDKYTGAPVRAAVGAAQNGQPVGKAFVNQFLKPPETAPSGKDIMSKAGLSEEEYNTPFISNPFTGAHFKASPAGVVGGVAEAGMDPLMYVPGMLEAKGLEVAGDVAARVAPKAGEALGHFAEERAVKAATGENRKAIRSLAKVNGQSAGDVDKALGNLRKTGRTLLEPDEAGAPVVGWLSNNRSIGENAAAKRQYYGSQIGQIGNAVDSITPTAISGPEMATDIRNYAQTIPNAGTGKTLRARLGEESKNFDDLGNMGFREAQKLKGQFKWKPEAADSLISNQDATNQINRIITNKMDNSSASALNKVAQTVGSEEELPAEMGLLKDVKPAQQNLDDLAQFQRAPANGGMGPPSPDRYKLARKSYELYKNISDAGTEQTLRTLGRRMVSPSSHAIGLGGGIAATAKEGLEKGGLIGMASAVANQVALSRGSAFAARAADAISKKIISAPGTYQKWLPTLQKAAKSGNAAVVTMHHQLMNDDPLYRQLMTESAAEEGP